MTFDGDAYNKLFHSEDAAPTKVYVKPKKETAQEAESAVEQPDQDAKEPEYEGAGDPPEEEIETEGGEE